MNGLAIGRLIEERERPKAQARRLEHLKRGVLTPRERTLSPRGNKRLRKVAENEIRKDFTRSEGIAIAKLIVERERPKAEARRMENQGRPRRGKTERDSSAVSGNRRLRKVAVIAGKAVG